MALCVVGIDKNRKYSNRFLISLKKYLFNMGVVMRYMCTFFFIILLISGIDLFGIDIKLGNKIKISDKHLLQMAISFCVTEDEYYLVVDFKAADVKVYNPKGGFEKVIGSKGAGPEEFIQPLFCYYEKGQFLVTDNGQRKIFFYKRENKSEFKRIDGIFCTSTGEYIKLYGNSIYIAGNKISKDSKYYSFFSFSLSDSGTYVYLLPSYIKFGFSSENQYKTELLKKPDLTTIGVNGKFDIQDDFAYYVWEGDLKIFRINLKTKDIQTFGKKFSNYVKPYSNQKLSTAFFNRNGAYISEERRKMSYIKQIFTTKKHVMVFYTEPSKKTEDEFYRIQFYKMDGKFIQEKEFHGDASGWMCFDKEKNLLYTIDLESNDTEGECYYILKYNILD